jgi:hypothetical protein
MWWALATKMPLPTELSSLWDANYKDAAPLALGSDRNPQTRGALPRISTNHGCTPTR